MRDRSPCVRSALLSATLATLTTLVACGGMGGVLSGDRVDGRRMRAVADDPRATADQVVRAGSAVDAAASGETVLVTYTVHSGTSEGRSVGAWRLYDEGGDPIATELAGLTDEGAASPRVDGLADGYLVRDAEGPVWHVGVDGTRERVRRATKPRPVTAADVALDDGSTRVYRPSTRMLFRAAPMADGNRQGWALSDDGTVWLQRLGRPDRVPFFRSIRGGRWEPAATYAPRAGQSVNSLTLTAVGDHVVVLVATEGQDPSQARLVGLLVRQEAAAPDRPWRLLEAKGVEGDDWWDARVDAVDATTVAVGTWGRPPTLVDVVSGDWRPMPAPTSENGWRYQYEHGRIYATHADHADARVTGDRGKRWVRLPH